MSNQKRTRWVDTVDPTNESPEERERRLEDYADREAMRERRRILAAMYRSQFLDDRVCEIPPADDVMNALGALAGYPVRLEPIIGPELLEQGCEAMRGLATAIDEYREEIADIGDADTSDAEWERHESAEALWETTKAVRGGGWAFYVYHVRSRHDPDPIHLEGLYWLARKCGAAEDTKRLAEWVNSETYRATKEGVEVVLDLLLPIVQSERDGAKPTRNELRRLLEVSKKLWGLAGETADSDTESGSTSTVEPLTIAEIASRVSSECDGQRVSACTIGRWLKRSGVARPKGTRRPVTDEQLRKLMKFLRRELDRRHSSQREDVLRIVENHLSLDR